MDQFVLIAVARDLDRKLRGATLVEFRQDSVHRFRAVFVQAERGRPVTISLRPERPWVGRPYARARRKRVRTTSFAAEVHRQLHDRIVARVRRSGPGRVLRIEFVDGRALIAELAPHGANLVLIDDGGRVRIAAKNPPSGRVRLTVGQPYSAPAVPEGAFDPLADSPAAIDAAIEARGAAGDDRATAVRRTLLGVAKPTAEAIVEEAVARGGGLGETARAIATRIADGRDQPVIEADFDVEAAFESGSFDPAGCRLLPFTPTRACPDGWTRTCPGGAAATVGLIRESHERAAWSVERRAGLETLLRREIGRLERVARNVERDRARFGSPDVHRRHGEALLAGLRSAVREGDRVTVPDPYDPSGRTVSIRVDPGRSLAQAADDLFARHRRAVRGIEAAALRLESVAARIDALVRLERRARAIETVEELETGMREAGIAVGLAEQRRAKLAELAAGARPRLEGVRMFTSSTGAVILVGKSARDNQHLTFGVAQPEDFWFHALERTGAHVLVRNPDRRRSPDGPTRTEAAALAAWYSEGRTDGAVDVQWTRRKYVRKARGGPPGAVLLKRFETVRVAPGHPPGQAGEM